MEVVHTDGLIIQRREYKFIFEDTNDYGAHPVIDDGAKQYIELDSFQHGRFLLDMNHARVVAEAYIKATRPGIRDRLIAAAIENLDNNRIGGK